jgi:hypothetical protein
LATGDRRINVTKNSTEDPSQLFARMLDIVFAQPIQSHAVWACARLRIADQLADGPRTADEVAQATGLHGPTTYRLLRALENVEVVKELSDRKFELTPFGSLLRSDVEGSMRGIAHFSGSVFRQRYWQELDYGLRTGKSAVEKVYGKPVFDYFTENPEDGKVFDEAMTSLTAGDAVAVLGAYDFSGLTKVVDVGGGHGSLLRAVLKDYPDARGTLFDLPHVVDSARQYFEQDNLTNRAELVAGDLFKEVPAGGDIYMMKYIIHDWTDDRAATILENCAKAMGPDSRVLIVEFVIPPPGEPNYGKLLDLEILLKEGGRERTEVEYADLLKGVGLRLNRVIPTQSPLSIVEGIPA